MYNKKRIELIVKDWFKLKTGIELSDDTISKMVDDITSLENEIQQSCLGDVSGRHITDRYLRSF